MSPLSQRGGAVSLEGVTAVQVTVLTEVTVDRGVGGGRIRHPLNNLPPVQHEVYAERYIPWAGDMAGSGTPTDPPRSPCRVTRGSA